MVWLWIGVLFAAAPPLLLLVSLHVCLAGLCLSSCGSGSLETWKGRKDAHQKPKLEIYKNPGLKNTCNEHKDNVFDAYTMEYC